MMYHAALQASEWRVRYVVGGCLYAETVCSAASVWYVGCLSCEILLLLNVADMDCHFQVKL